MVVQRLRICLAMHGPLIPFLVQEDPECGGQLSPRTTTKSMCHNHAHRARALQQEKPQQ